MIFVCLDYTSITRDKQLTIPQNNDIGPPADIVPAKPINQLGNTAIVENAKPA